METKWTAKGKPKDGYYFEGWCPKCKNVSVAKMGSAVACSKCNNDWECKVKITEKPNGNK